MKHLRSYQLLALGVFGFGLGMISATLEPGLLGFQVLNLAPDIRNTVLGLTTFVGLVVAGLTQPVMGALSDRAQSRWGRRLPFFILGTIGASVGLLWVLLAFSLPLLLVGVIGLQFATNTIQGPWQALIPDHVPDDQRGLASGLKLLCEGSAAIVGRVITGQLLGLVPVWGQPALYATVAVPIFCLLLALGITAWTIRNSPPAPPAVPRSLSETLKNSFSVDLRAYPAFRWWFLNRLFFWFALIAVSIFLLFFAIDVLGLTQGQAQQTIGQVTAVLGGTLVLCAIPVSRLADRLPRKPMVIVAGVLAGIGTLIILSTHNLILLTGGGALIGAGVGIYAIAGWALITEIVPRAEAARYLGMANVATTAGSALARVLGGGLIDFLNGATHSNSTGYLVLYALAATFFFLSALTILPLRLAKQTEVS